MLYRDRLIELLANIWAIRGMLQRLRGRYEVGIARATRGTLTALGDVDVDVRGLGVSGTTGVVAGVTRRGAADGQRRLRLGPRLREHAHARRRVVVDHARVVVPEHVLRRHRALRKRNQLASSCSLPRLAKPNTFLHWCSTTSSLFMKRKSEP